MKPIRALLLLSIVFSFAFTSSDLPEAISIAKKWVSLFNGKDMADWQPKFVGHQLGENFKNTFRIQDGLLTVRYDQYDSFRNTFGALYYNKVFNNYRLKVEYRFVGETTPGAPSWGFRDNGVQYHGQAPNTIEINQNFPVSLEYNLLGGNGKEDRPSGALCANGIFVQINGVRNPSYCNAATVARTFHGDQWVTLEIEVNDGKIKHFVNGAEILQFENPRYDPKHAMAKNFIANDDMVRQGYISLQSNSHPIDFRKIEIMEY